MSSGCACCKARFVKFRLTEDISCDDLRQEAQVEAYWDGDDPTPSTGSFYVYNLSCEEAYGEPVKWAYQGSAGWVGYAVLDDQNSSGSEEDEECFYRIIELLPCCGGQATIRFEITSANVTAGTATATILSRPCGMSKVAGESSGTVNVTDALGCFFTGETNASLVGRKGYATYMDGTLECQWDITSLCC